MAQCDKEIRDASKAIEKQNELHGMVKAALGVADAPLEVNQETDTESQSPPNGFYVQQAVS